MEKTIRLNTFSTMVSTVVGLIAIGLVVWRGGGLAMWINNIDDKHTSKILIVEKRVSALESDGSVKVQKHIDTDEKLQAINESRLNKHEAAIEEIRRMLGDMSGDTKVIRRSVDDMLTQINLHMQVR